MPPLPYHFNWSMKLHPSPLAVVPSIFCKMRELSIGSKCALPLRAGLAMNFGDSKQLAEGTEVTPPKIRSRYASGNRVFFLSVNRKNHE